MIQEFCIINSYHKTFEVYPYFFQVPNNLALASVQVTISVGVRFGPAGPNSNTCPMLYAHNAYAIENFVLKYLIFNIYIKIL